IAVGARIPLYKNIALLASVNIQQAATTAISGNTPTATDVSGNTISYAPLTVLSTNIGVSLGIVRRFDIF
ncbi:MAG TPA: hypothetical protein PLY93_13615, partial [Turneriella sp.]|nr:hypothetical protein [Turneriella sp.]